MSFARRAAPLRIFAMTACVLLTVAAGEAPQAMKLSSAAFETGACVEGGAEVVGAA